MFSYLCRGQKQRLKWVSADNRFDKAAVEFLSPQEIDAVETFHWVRRQAEDHAQLVAQQGNYLGAHNNIEKKYKRKQLPLHHADELCILRNVL